jgi:transposase-like protein
MNRPKGYCPACEAVVEFYSDGLSGNASYEWRCGNCFQGFHEEQLTRLEKVHQELLDHAAQRQKILDDALRG